MRDARHKRSPLKGALRKVTPLFVKQVEAALKANDVHNTQHRLRKGDRGYRPSSHADLADATGAHQNAISDLLGGVRAGTQSKQPERSRLVDPICELLGIKRFVEVSVPADLAALIERLAALSPEDRAAIEEEVRKKR